MADTTYNHLFKVTYQDTNNCILTRLGNDHFLKQWESFPINEEMKSLAEEVSQKIDTIRNSLEEKSVSDLFRPIVNKDDATVFKITSYGCEDTPVEVVSKGKYSFILLTSQVISIYGDVKKGVRNEAYSTLITPIIGKVENVLFEYDIYTGKTNIEFIILNEHNQSGVFDQKGTNIMPFQSHNVSFIESALCGIQNTKLYLVKNEQVRYFSLYHKNKPLFSNVIRAISYFSEEHQYLVVCFYDGWQVYDFTPWLNKETNTPVALLRRRSDIDGKEPLPLYLSENKIGVSSGTGYGFMELNTGELVIPCVYYEIIKKFENGKAQVAIDSHGNYIVIDEKNTILKWGNTFEEELEKESRSYYRDDVDWDFREELKDFKDNWDPN